MQGRLRRGPYRTKNQVPRQTIYNRKWKLAEEGLRDTTEVDEVITAGETASSDESFTIPYGEDRGLQADMDNSLQVALTGSLLPDTNITTADDSLRLYGQSSLSLEESHVLISSYMCCHNLTGQAREDLLQLMQLHLPPCNNLSPSLYTFAKYTEHTIDIESDYHYYCSVCYFLLPSSDATNCLNRRCNATINKDDMKFFITVPVAAQLKHLLESKHALINFENSLVYLS